MHFTIPSLALLASIAIAAPSDNPWKDDGVLDPWGEYGNTQKRQNNEWKDAGILDPWGQYGNEETKNITTRQVTNGAGTVSRTRLGRDMLREIVKRTSIGEFKNYLPGCSSDDDPSKDGTPLPQWPVNHGVKIPKEGDDDQCTKGHNGDHCWTEYRLVEAAIEYLSWQPAGGAINCDGTDTCSSTETNIKQSCSNIGSTETNGFDWKIIDASAKLKPSGLASGGEADISTGWSFKHEKTNVNLKQTCSTFQSSQTCSWKPNNTAGADNCHQVWYADRVLHFWGQAQRTCNKCTDGKVQQNTGDGKVCVRGQKEFDLVLPINKLVHCNGKCNQADPGMNVPPNSKRAAYAEPADWDSLHLRTKEDPNQ
ncbi:MAG: hypothetical protein Q9227_000773 [Pyrenula ochraceoflavens]